MLALTCAGSVGTLPVRGGLTSLLAGSAAGYWQSAPRSAGAANGGSGAIPGGVSVADDVAGVVVDADALVLSESRLVTITVATTATTTRTAPTAEPTMVKRRLRFSWAARRSSCRSSLRFAVALR